MSAAVGADVNTILEHLDGAAAKTLAFGLERPLGRDAGVVSQWFGANPANYAPYGLAGHEGLDYAVQEGTEVLAAHDGTILEAHQEGPYGLHVLITNDTTGVSTVYGHLGRAVVRAGQIVRAGEPVGLSGNTGRSTGPHLHFGFKVRNMRNPAYQDWLDPMLGRKLAGDL